MEFLIDFHGRDLLKAFRDWLSSRRIELSYKRLCDELIPAAIRQYDGNRTIYGETTSAIWPTVSGLAGLAPLV